MRRLAILLVVVSVAVAAALVWLRRPDERAPVAAATTGPPTATVTRETLVDARTVPGTLAWGAEREVAARVTGTVTWLPAVNSVVRRGQALFRIDDRPVVLMYGALPAYRELGLGVKGPDVRQLERNLARLGMRGFTVDEEFSAATEAAVGRWQELIGLPRTGKVELGRVLFAAGAQRVASHLLTPGQVVEGPIVTCTGTDRRVSATLAAADRALAAPGAGVTVTLASGAEVPGKVAAVHEVTEGEAPGGLQAEVAIDDQKALRGLKDETVRVRLIAGRRDHVLTLPVTALLALAGGGYGVERATGGVLEVTTGLFADGRVEVEGDGIAEGLVVRVAS